MKTQTTKSTTKSAAMKKAVSIKHSARTIAAFRAHITRLELKAIECGDAKEGQAYLDQAAAIAKEMNA